MAENLHLDLTIKGKVQGVWYRKSTQMQANKLGIRGFVKNQEDGSVYAEMEGTTDQLDQMVEWCKIGPDLARVSEVNIAHGKWKNFKEFQIVR